MAQDIGNSVALALRESLLSTANFLPNLVIAAIIFIVGVIVASIFRSALVKLLSTIGFEKTLEPTGVSKALKKADSTLTISGLLGELIRWFIILVFLIPAADQLGLGAVNEVLKSLLLYIPSVVVAVIIVAVGAVFAKIGRDFASAAATGLGTDLAQIVGEVARWSIIIFTLLAALTQLGVATDLVKILFTGLVAMLALAGGLAFGLGGKETAEALLKRFFDRINK